MYGMGGILFGLAGVQAGLCRWMTVGYWGLEENGGSEERGGQQGR